MTTTLNTTSPQQQATREPGHRMLRIGTFVFPLHLRSLIVVTGAMLFGCVVFVVGLGLGDYPLTPSEVLTVLFGGGTRLQHMVVFDWRLARALVAVAVGLVLGMAGAITQSIARNALASPDVLGISMGASAAAVWVIGFGGQLAQIPMVIPLVATGGAALTAAVILLLSRGTGTETYRLVLIGIGVNSMLSSVVSFVLASAESDSAALALVWLTGSVNGRGITELIPVLVVLFVVGVLVLPTARDLRPLQLGESSASSLGVNVGRRRVLMLAAAVVLTAAAVAAVGPVSFVAFVAPQVAVRLQRAAHPPLVGSAVCGAVLVLTADVIARVALPWELPVGIVTAAIGGPFLLYVIVTNRRRITL
ncbi:FecCD family ABC transporter permease [Kocuria sp.]|uniref:FecCD family ABC transporter permease n=1 Tax=Kocuria sp. TaxID=1871328 RepID=UPI0026E0E74A|nr:iron chelate uptake ABC transporter family permease subunit [Kocuria sp.]MDO5618415.1 iron chelate uptake ABC transporter family permease subunit [Kocuria sp.]